MNIFQSGKLTWWQVSLLKWSVLLMGLAIGANWPEVFAPHTVLLVVVSLVVGVYLAFIWFKK